MAALSGSWETRFSLRKDAMSAEEAGAVEVEATGTGVEEVEGVTESSAFLLFLLFFSFFPSAATGASTSSSTAAAFLFFSLTGAGAAVSSSSSSDPAAAASAAAARRASLASFFAIFLALRSASERGGVSAESIPLRAILDCEDARGSALARCRIVQGVRTIVLEIVGGRGSEVNAGRLRRTPNEKSRGELGAGRRSLGGAR